MEHESKPKKSKGLIATVIILILIIIGLCTYIAYDKGIIFKSSADVEEKKEKPKKEVKKEEPKEETEELKILGLNEENIVNKNDKVYDLNKDTTMNIKINSDKKSVTVTLDWTDLSKSFNNERTDTEEKTISFDKEVKEVLSGGSGQDITGMAILYLMEDGTVEYTPIYKAINANDFRSYGALPTITDIVRLENASVCRGIGCWVTTLGQKSDGTLYDFDEAFNSTGNFGV